MTIKIAKVK